MSIFKKIGKGLKKLISNPKKAIQKGIDNVRGKTARKKAEAANKKVQDKIKKENDAARKKEQEREKRIRDGSAAIDKTFSRFNDRYFKNYLQKYKKAHVPLLDRQFKDAKDQTTFALARAGTLKSSMAGDRQARLGRDYRENLAQLLSQGRAQVDEHRTGIAGEKAGLVSLLNQTGDATRIGNEATARTQVLYNRTPTFSPLGDAFAGAANGIGQWLGQRQEQQRYDAYVRGGANGSSARIVK
jgi:hypothetical protein